MLAARLRGEPFKFDAEPEPSENDARICLMLDLPVGGMKYLSAEQRAKLLGIVEMMLTNNAKDTDGAGERDTAGPLAGGVRGADADASRHAGRAAPDSGD